MHFITKDTSTSEGRVVHIDATPTLTITPCLKVLTLANGDFYKVNAPITVTFGDASTLEVEAGDGLLAI